MYVRCLLSASHHAWDFQTARARPAASLRRV